MPKIDRSSIKEIKNCDTLRIFKYENSSKYYVSFYVSKRYSKNGRYEQSLKTKNVNEAASKAKELWRGFDKVAVQKTDKEFNFDKDIAQPFFKSRLKKYIAKGTPQYAKKEEQRYINFIKPYLENVDYRKVEYLENAVDDLVIELKQEKKLKDTTISKYINLVSLLFQKGFKMRKIEQLPDLPTMQRINEERPMYLPREIRQIVNAMVDEYRRTEDPFYDECADYVNFCRSCGVRPGLEPLRIKKFQQRFINDPENPNEPVLVFTIKTKTKPKHKLTMHPEFVRQVFPKMMSRYPSSTAEDYIFFPKEKNREKVYDRIRKNFTRVSRELELYYRNGKERPLYSIRHTFITNQVNQDVPMQIVADSSSTSIPVINSNYLEDDDQTILKRHKKLFGKNYTKVKVTKIVK
ncbi:MAG: hypothetical protein CL661_12525 [Bacteroidetes bacterium]|nr:hypothetical protein [Bacteroidota bacterium]